MRSLIAKASIFVLTIVLAGCASQRYAPAAFGVDGVPCSGKVAAAPAGLVEMRDDALLFTAEGAAGQGRLCAGKVFVVEQSVTVYRVWEGAKEYTALGGWWAFSAPQGPREQYREANEICPSWSKLDRMSRCMIKVGTRIVVGPGQSAVCPAIDAVVYDKSEANQVYIPNDARRGDVLVENCTPGADWP